MSILDKILYRLQFYFCSFFGFTSAWRYRNKFKNSVFIVYSNGHTGSTTVYYNLLKYLTFNKVFHVHLLSEYWKRQNKVLENDHNDRLSQKVINYIERHPSKNYYFITLIRDPLSRSISSYFHNKKYIGIDTRNINYVTKHIIKETDMEKNIAWFEKDYNDYFKLDYKDLDFKPDKGYHVFEQKKNVMCLLVKTTELNRVFKQAFYEMTGVELGDLKGFNSRKDTSVGVLYGEVKSGFSLNKVQWIEFFDNDFCRTFFTNKEYQKFKKSKK